MTGVAVIIPARDEGNALGDTLYSLSAQSVRPDRIIVVVNNSTDDTGAIAQAYADLPGVPATEVLIMPGVNRFKKAGALNYGIRHLTTAGRFPISITHLLVMDGDTDLDARFIEYAKKVMDRDPVLGGVSAACLGKQIKGKNAWQRILLLIQRIEYGRYASGRVRRNVHTMSGAGSFYRVDALAVLLNARPDVFEERDTNLVEDYETTLALKARGWKVTTNQNCIAYTDLMPTMKMLIAQRVRWTRGTVDEWKRYGVTRETWLPILLMPLGIGVAIWSVLNVTMLTTHGEMNTHLLPIVALFGLYRAYGARHLGWRAIIFEALLLPEIAFGLVYDYWLIKAILVSFFSRRISTWS